MGLNEERPQAEYGTGEQVLYTAVEMVWNSYLEYLADFAGWNTSYSAAIGTDQLAALKTARALPDEAQRDELHSSLNKELGVLADDCLIIWQHLQTFIRDGFDPLVYQDKLNAAGYAHYRLASQHKWVDVQSLVEDGELFIADNTAALLDGGMVPTFAASFTVMKEAFDTKYSNFLQAEETAKVIRDAKIDANNALYHTAMAMCSDGKKVFRKRAALREQFTWTTVVDLIRTLHSRHSVRGFVLNADESPIDGARVLVLGKDGVAVKNKFAVTDVDGSYRIIGLLNGKYVLRVEAEGFEIFEVGFEVDGGPVEVGVVLEGSIEE